MKSLACSRTVSEFLLLAVVVGSAPGQSTDRPGIEEDSLLQGRDEVPPGTLPSFQESEALITKGRDLDREAVAELEARLLSDEGDLATRITLLGYYQSHQIPDELATTKYEKQVLWLIDKYPHWVGHGAWTHLQLDRNRMAFRRGAELWLGHVDASPKSERILLGAASFFANGSREAAEWTPIAGPIAGPDPDWYRQLGWLLQIAMRDGQDHIDLNVGRRSLHAYQRGLEIVDRNERCRLLENAARVALDVGDLEMAEAYAKELLDEVDARAAEARKRLDKDELDARLAQLESEPDSEAGKAWRALSDDEREKTARMLRSDPWRYFAGTAIHYGNLVLGHVALRRGNIDQAEKYLLEAGKTPGAPTLNSFGPNMLLARDLLIEGSRDAVIEYLESCKLFWEECQLDLWIAQVRAGDIPEFGANLVY